MGGLARNAEPVGTESAVARLGSLGVPVAIGDTEFGLGSEVEGADHGLGPGGSPEEGEVEDLLGRA